MAPWHNKGHPPDLIPTTVRGLQLLLNLCSSGSLPSPYIRFSCSVAQPRRELGSRIDATWVCSAHATSGSGVSLRRGQSLPSSLSLSLFSLFSIRVFRRLTVLL